MLGRHRRLALLAEGAFTPLDAKTAVGVLRYRPEEVVAVIDGSRAGATAGALVGVGGDVPVVADVAAAAALGADGLLIGIAPQGGGLPEAWRAPVREALARGWDVLSGLHVALADDPEFAALAARGGAVIHDVRRPPAERPVAAARAAAVDALVVLTVGTDCNVGKMTAALETVAALRARGARAAFVATGQTGIFLADRGAAVDAVAADFVAGVTERLVLEAADGADVVVVEGQGALFHPAYSGVTLGLLHGACPSALVLCHECGRAGVRRRGADDPTFPLPPLPAARAAYETASAWLRPARVVAAALHTGRLDAADARAACADAAAALGVPATDPVRFGAAPIADALLAFREARRATHA
uniref:DUF1611 domain-containing protein n=1 Tax=Eiseniibacteriota bacterium TaxID=2212470 RepID=A0A832I053_UNCEI